MNTWLEPIFDRTAEDVEFAKQQIQAWIGQVLTGNPAETRDLKGCLNLSDLNRIEGNIRYLSDKLGELRYGTSVTTKVWERRGLPTEQDVRRIISNIQVIIDAYHQRDSSPNLPNDMNTYRQINDIEQNLNDIKQLLDAMIESFPKSGTLRSGGARMLPIRR